MLFERDATDEELWPFDRTMLTNMWLTAMCIRVAETEP